MNTRLPAVALAMACASAASAGNTSSDVQVVMVNSGASFYFVSSFAPPEAAVAATGSGNPNPTMALLIGRRYRFTCPTAHPFTFIAKGGSAASDTQLLDQGAVTGAMEADPGVDWFESGTNMYFTLTPQLADAMSTPSHVPGYRCGIHTSTMRGNFGFAIQPTVLTWAGVEEETFENSVLGRPLVTVSEEWSRSLGGPLTADIVATPAGDPGQVPGSTRWLTITDNDTGSGDLVEHVPILSPEGEPVHGYTIAWAMDVQAIAAGVPVRIVSKSFDGFSGYFDVAGLEVTETGVNVAIIGTDDGGVGTAGATLRTPLFTFAQAEEFGMNHWVSVHFEVNLDEGFVHGAAIGSGGGTMEAMLPGLAIQGAGILPGNVEISLRHDAAGGTATISYDQFSFTGDSGTVVQHPTGWLAY